MNTAPVALVVAVLPFVGGGGESAAHLADTLADDIAPSLARLRWLKVARPPPATGTVNRPDPRRMGQELRAGYVVHGSVQEDWNRIRVIVALVETATGRLLWGDQQQVALGEAEALRRRVPARVTEAVEQRLRGLAGAGRGFGDTQARPRGPDDEQTQVRASLASPHKLVLMEGDRSGYRIGHEIPLTAAALTIGRQAPSDLILPSSEVSRAHCRVGVVDGAVVVTDLNSTNGTYVDDRRLAAPTRLRPEQLLKVGPYVLRYAWQEPVEAVDPNATMVRTPGSQKRNNAP